MLRGEQCPGEDLFNPSPQDLCTALMHEVFVDVIKVRCGHLEEGGPNPQRVGDSM